MSERIYYRVNEDSPVMAVIRDVRAIDDEFRKAAKGLQEEHPGCEVCTSGRQAFSGIKFPGKPPVGWRQGKEHAYPDRRTKAGREIAKRFESLPHGVDSWRFSGMLSKALGGQWEYWGDGHVYFPTLEKVGGEYVISVPAASKITPPGCTELRMSEYCNMREAAAA